METSFKENFLFGYNLAKEYFALSRNIQLLTDPSCLDAFLERIDSADIDLLNLKKNRTERKLSCPRLKKAFGQIVGASFAYITKPCERFETRRLRKYVQTRRQDHY